MSLTLQGLRTAIYKVPDINKAKAWYTQALGFGPYFDEPFYVGFNVGGYELGLMPVEDSEHNAGDNLIVYWGVDDAETAFNALIEKGATAHEEPTDVGSGIIVATVKDR